MGVRPGSDYRSTARKAICAGEPFARRLWLNTPRDPKTGEPRRKLWLGLIPIIILLTVVSMVIGPFLRWPMDHNLAIFLAHHPALTPANSWDLQKYRPN